MDFKTIKIDVKTFENYVQTTIAIAKLTKTISYIPNRMAI